MLQKHFVYWRPNNVGGVVYHSKMGWPLSTRESEINEALKQEDARREAAVKNMLRLRALRLERDAKSKKQ